MPVAGDVYDAGKLGKRTHEAWRKMQDLENEYVGKIYEKLKDIGDDSKLKKFKKSMRNAGVRDARKDQKAGYRPVSTPIKQEYSFKFRLLNIMLPNSSLRSGVYLCSISPLV